MSNQPVYGVTGSTVWFAGESVDGKVVLLGVSETGRHWVELPHEEEVPQLGISGDNLLAIYSNGVYQLDGTKWVTLYSGNISAPKLTPPPRKYGDYLVYFNDGPFDMSRELQLHNLSSGVLTSVQQKLDVIRPDGPRWETAISYALMDGGNLWVTFRHLDTGSLVRRNPDGTYGIAVINNGVQFDGHLLYSAETDLGLSISAIYVQDENQAIFFSDRGMYSLSDDVIAQLLAFENTAQKIPVVVAGHNSVYHWTWIPSEVVSMGQGTFVISLYLTKTSIALFACSKGRCPTNWRIFASCNPAKRANIRTIAQIGDVSNRGSGSVCIASSAGNPFRTGLPTFC